MKRRVRRHAAVEDDIVAIAHWIAGDNLPAARRFLSASEETIVELNFMPEKGSLNGWAGKDFESVRTWAVRGFPNHLVVYEVRGSDVFVYAVVHGSRNYHETIRTRLEDR